MQEFEKMSAGELKALELSLTKRYEDFKNKNLTLDMSRGKPCSEQLELSMGMFDVLKCGKDYMTSNNIDTRNYGGIDGIPEAKVLFAQMLGVSPKEIIIGGNSSLNIMYDTIARALIFGVLGSKKPWGTFKRIKFLCPSPGYDRHFAICENLGIEMITIPMKSNGPDMDLVEELVANDESIKGMWCVPKYSNPEGITYSDGVVDRLASMKTKASDFRIFWDNSYVVHHLYDESDHLKDILSACKSACNQNRVLIFSSTSKISFPGSGLAMCAASEDNINFIKKQMAYQTIGPDKVNQLRHVRFFKSIDGIEKHMKKHAEIIRPKFEAALEILETELSGKEIAWWNKPNGGYFISLNTLEGCAKAVVSMAADAGVTLTNAGATFPYGKDPLDRNIRIAPTYPPLNELKQAIELLCICVQLISVKAILNKNMEIATCFIRNCVVEHKS